MHDSILEELRRALLDRVRIDSLPQAVWERFGARNTWGSNAIEGNSLTWREVERLLLRGKTVANRRRRDVLETLQHQRAFLDLPKRAAGGITLVTALELHDAVFRLILPDAGRWRWVNVIIAGASHVPPPKELVLFALDAWERECRHREERGDAALPLGAWMHGRFEAIHPLSDGNGRVGRLLLNLHLLRHGWPPVHVLPADRDRYLGALEMADGEDFGQLEAFLRTAMARSLLELLDQVGTTRDRFRSLSAAAGKAGMSARELALRANRGELPAVRRDGRWHTSGRALSIYRRRVRSGRYVLSGSPALSPATGCNRRVRYPTRTNR